MCKTCGLSALAALRTEQNMTLQLKEQFKVHQLVDRIQRGNFDANDVDNLLMKLRPYAGNRKVFREIADFAAHSDARDRGLAQQSILGFVDSIRYFQEYASEKRTLELDKTFPAYVYRLFLSQARLSDERKLRADYKMSHATLERKIEANFSVDKKTGTCSLRNNKGGVELLAALQFVTGFIHSRTAFSLHDFHEELKEVMRVQRVAFEEAAWGRQSDRVSLAVLCLVSNTEFQLDGGVRASCKLGTEHHFRLLRGQRRLPTGLMSSEPTSFGKLLILGEATVVSANRPPLRIAFPLIDTSLDPHEHCDGSLFRRELAPQEFGDCDVEVIDLAPDMSLSNDFRLVRTDSLIQ